MLLHSGGQVDVINPPLLLVIPAKILVASLEYHAAIFWGKRLLKLEGREHEKREVTQHAWKIVVPFRDRQGVVVPNDHGNL